MVLASGARTIRHEGARTAPLWEMARHRGHKRGIPWNESRIKETLLDQVWRLTRLMLVVPATSATAERSFSALRRLKTYSRATMGQPRLNSLLILHCHQDRAENLNLKAIFQKFVCACDQRSVLFLKLRGTGLSCIHNFVATSLYPTDYFVRSWLVVDTSRI